MAGREPDAQQSTSAATLLTVEVTERDEGVIVRLVGELDAITADSAAAAVDQASSRTGTFVLDMTGIEFFASVGLNLLVRLHQKVKDHGVDVRLAVDSSAVLRPLELMGLADLFPTYRTVAAALAATTTQR
jgi:anti-sigma B factor antagonist